MRRPVVKSVISVDQQRSERDKQSNNVERYLRAGRPAFRDPMSYPESGEWKEHPDDEKHNQERRRMLLRMEQ